MQVVTDLSEITSQRRAKTSQPAGNPLPAAQPDGKVRQDKTI
jgi:hypothetical protein